MLTPGTAKRDPATFSCLVLHLFFKLLIYSTTLYVYSTTWFRKAGHWLLIYIFNAQFASVPPVMHKLMQYSYAILNLLLTNSAFRGIKRIFIECSLNGTFYYSSHYLFLLLMASNNSNKDDNKNDFDTAIKDALHFKRLKDKR